MFGWRKTFRIMLEHHQIPFDDIVTVVTALGDKRLHLDFARYHSPYDLVRRRGEVTGTPGEWENILDWVKLALKREQSRPTLAPSRQLPFDDDDVHVHPRDDDAAVGQHGRQRRGTSTPLPGSGASTADDTKRAWQPRKPAPAWKHPNLTRPHPAPGRLRTKEIHR